MGPIHASKISLMSLHIIKKELQLLGKLKGEVRGVVW